MDEKTFLSDCTEIVTLSEGEWAWQGYRGLRRRVAVTPERSWSVDEAPRSDEEEEEEDDDDDDEGNGSESLQDDDDAARAADLGSDVLLTGTAFLSHSAAFGCPIVSFTPSSHTLTDAAAVLPPSFAVGPCPLTGAGALVMHPCETATVLSCMKKDTACVNATLQWLSAFGGPLGLTVPLAWLRPSALAAAAAPP